LALNSILCRSETKAAAAIEKIKSEIPQAQLEFIQFDLTSIASCQQAALDFLAREERLDVLMNNAGIVSALTSLAHAHCILTLLADGLAVPTLLRRHRDPSLQLDRPLRSDHASLAHPRIHRCEARIR
jgi:NAD(P)-dependent dehydrogenase (short-subunit alcohol dehydrogenase family)